DLEAEIMAQPEGQNFVHNSGDDALAARYAAAHPDVIDQLLAASSLSHCELPYQYDEKPFANLNTIRPFATASRLLMADATRAYRRGDYERFARSSLAADRILWRLGREPGEKPLLAYAGEQLRLGRVILGAVTAQPTPDGARASQ